MVTFIIKNPAGLNTHLFTANGEVDIQTEQKFMHVRKHPYIPTKEYRHRPYITEKISVNIVLSKFSSVRLRDIFLNNIETDIYLQWKDGDYIYVRKLDVKDIPSPVIMSELMKLAFSINYTELPVPFDTGKLTRIHTSVGHHLISVPAVIE